MRLFMSPKERITLMLEKKHGHGWVSVNSFVIEEVSAVVADTFFLYIKPDKNINLQSKNGKVTEV